MVEGDHGSDAVFVTRRQHPPVMIQRGHGETSLLRFDTRPLDGKPVTVQAESGKESNVLREAVIVVARIERGFLEQSRIAVFQDPEVAVHIVAFYLVRGRSGAPEKTGRK